jgi:hypothetical protein
VDSADQFEGSVTGTTINAEHAETLDAGPPSGYVVKLPV